MAQVFWHNLSFKETAKLLRTNVSSGLSEKQVKIRAREFGKNAFPGEKPLPRLRIFFDQFKSPLIYILLIAGIITLSLKEFGDTLVIFGAVFLNTIIGYFQENKASQAIKELRKVIKYKAQVIREKNIKIIDSSELVPGDIFILNPGDKVPTDGRLIESYNLKVNEMALTGEWLSAKKHCGVLTQEISLADRDNMVYMGTIIENGKAKAIAVNIGVGTEIGKVAEMIKQTKEEKTPYQKKLSRFSQIIGVIIGLISLLIFIEGMITLTDIELIKRFEEMLTTAVAIAVAAIPEGLPVAMTVILALGMQRILKKKGLVRKLIAAETLGSTSIIATDKTATLTEGKIKVTKVLTECSKKLVYKIAILCNEAFVENLDFSKDKWKFRGRPTDKALLSFGLESGLSLRKIDKEMPKIDEMPFDSEKKFLATLHTPIDQAFDKKDKSKERNILFIAGAPERILEMSKMKQEEREKWENDLKHITGQGFRAIAFAQKQTKKRKIDDELLKNLDLVALLGLSDPIRKDVKEAMRICRQAGMRPIIVTGDHKLTAKSVAEQIGFKTKKENILEGKDLDQLSDKKFQKILVMK